jgi:hypothetical protein
MWPVVRCFPNHFSSGFGDLIAPWAESEVSENDSGSDERTTTTAYYDATYEWRWMTEAGSNSQVNKTGDTGVVMAASSGNSTPTGLNFVYIMMTQDSSSDPYFRVVYTLGGPMVIIAADGD